MAKKRNTKKKAAPKPKPAPKPKGPQPGEIPPRTGWYLGSAQNVVFSEGDVYCVTLYDPNDNRVAAAYGVSSRVVHARALQLYKALAPKGKR